MDTFAISESINSRTEKIYSYIHKPFIGSLHPLEYSYHYHLKIDHFHSENKRYIINPDLIFQWKNNKETGLYEVFGSGIYEDIMTYGESLEEALDILRDGIIPIFWQDCVDGNDASLTKRAQSIVRDLRERVKIECR